MELTEQIASFETQIQEKRGKIRSKQTDLAYQKQTLAIVEGNIRGINQDILALRTAREKLERARDALKELLVPIPHTYATVPLAATTVVPPMEHTYEAVRVDDIRGTNEWYKVETVLVDGSYFVFRCDCPRFRFTKGELASGKTCKHIERYAQSFTRTYFEASARVAARKSGAISRTAGGRPIFHNNYNGFFSGDGRMR